MSETWFTADCHFGHQRIIELCKRPFASVEEMDETIVANWNAVVARNDSIWVLGDFAHRASGDSVRKVFLRLNGQKRLIIGNHDNKDVLRLPWHSPPVLRDEVKLHDGSVSLDHYPLREWQGLYRGACHFYGHVHGTLPPLGRSLDVGVDAHAFAPIHSSEAVRMAIFHDPGIDYDPKVVSWSPPVSILPVS